MNTSQLAALRWMMERELSALRSPRMSPEISLKCPDENELASRLSERAVDERLTARRVERIRDLENALRRIEVMDYGVCEACGEPIPLLRALGVAFGTVLRGLPAGTRRRGTGRGRHRII